jgi:hypothetical protein
MADSRSNQFYGIPQSDPGASFATNKYQGVAKVRPYSAVNRTTKGQAMAWDNPQPGVGGSFMKFDDDATTPPPTSSGA